MYFWTVRLLTRMPSLSSSPRMRSAPQRRLSAAIERMRVTVSRGTRGNGARERHRQRAEADTMPPEQCGRLHDEESFAPGGCDGRQGHGDDAVDAPEARARHRAFQHDELVA
jgi:hypothetical protein